MQMNAVSIVKDKAAWEALGVKLPAYDREAVAAATKAHPIWVHFGAGNIFRGFIAALQQKLLDEGLSDKGIIAADTFDYDIITKIYDPYDNLTGSTESSLGILLSITMLRSLIWKLYNLSVLI